MASPLPTNFGNQYLDHGDRTEIAIREVGRVFDLIQKLRSLDLQFNKTNGVHQEARHMHELAQSLFGESLQGLNHALCIMKSKRKKIELIKPENSLDGTGSPVYSHHGSPANSYDSDKRVSGQKPKRRRVEDYSWTTVTCMPFDDGYQWRKYGEKKISNSDFPRSYFRCTYKDEQTCQATKLVQQKNCNDPPLFDVKYSHKHTCNSVEQIIGPSHEPHVDPFISIENYNDIDQITFNSMKDCNHVILQPIEHQVSVLNDDNLREFLNGASMTPSSNGWDMDSWFMELGAGLEEDDSFHLRSLKSF